MVLVGHHRVGTRHCACGDRYARAERVGDKGSPFQALKDPRRMPDRLALGEPGRGDGSCPELTAQL